MQLPLGKRSILKSLALILLVAIGLSSPLSLGLAHAYKIAVAPIAYMPSNPRPTINQTITFSENWTGGGGLYTYSWAFGDGSANVTSTYTNATGNMGTASTTHAYATAGSFTVKFAVSDNGGTDSGSAQTALVVRGLLTADFSFPSTATFGDRIQFTATVSNGTQTLAGTWNFTFRWNYGDGGTNTTTVSTTTKPTQATPATSTTIHVVHASFTVSVQLTVSDPFGESSGQIIHTIEVGGLLGIDCGYGSNEAVYNATRYPNPDGAQSTGNAGASTLDPSCSWAGGPDISAGGEPGGGTYLTPLVSDSPTSIGASCCQFQGGGFTADIVYIQGGSSAISGFDVTVSWNPNVLYAVEFDETGLPFYGVNSFTSITVIDNSAGMAELSQTILSPPSPTATLSGNVTLFRIRFDVVGIGATSLTVSSDKIIDVSASPNALPHETIQGSFTSSNIPDLFAGTALGYEVNWTYTPNPEVPSAPLTLTAQASCPGCTGALTYKWDTDSSQGYPDPSTPPATIEAAGSTITITAPSLTLQVYRVTLIVNDSLGHVAEATRRLPLAAPVVSSLGPLTVGSAGTLQAKWLGGIPPYTGSTGQVGVTWKNLCYPSNLICSNPNPRTTTTSVQNNNVTVTYHFAGVYAGEVDITDTGLSQIPTSPTTVKGYFRLNVTGTPQVFTVAVTTNASSTTGVGQTVSFNVVIAYDPNYPGAARSTQFNYTIIFGDGSQQLVPSRSGAFSTTHAYSSAGTYTITVLAQESSGQALSKVTEAGFYSLPVTVIPLTGSFSFTPSSVTVAQSVSFAATASGGQGPYSFSWDFGDGSTGTGASPSHSYSASGSYTVTLTVTDSAGHSTTSTQTLTIPAGGGGGNASMLYLEIGGVIAAAVVAGLAGLLLLRRRRTATQSSR